MHKHLSGALLILSAIPALSGSEADLAKQSQNPVANLISIPMGNNEYFDVGPTEEMAYVTIIKLLLPQS